MNAIHDFEQQASLESFLFHLQQLCPDSLLYVYDDIAQTWIYEYAQDASVSAATGKTLKNQLLKLKLQSQSASQPQTGLLQLPNSAKAWHYHSLNIRVHTADFTGCFSVHDKFHRTLILSGFCLLKIAKISLNSSFFPKPIKR